MVALMGTFSKLTSWRSATRAIRLSKLDGHDFFMLLRLPAEELLHWLPCTCVISAVPSLCTEEMLLHVLPGVQWAMLLYRKIARYAVLCSVGCDGLIPSTFIVQQTVMSLCSIVLGPVAGLCSASSCQSIAANCSACKRV